MKTVRVRDRQVGWLRAVLVTIAAVSFFGGNAAFARQARPPHKEGITAEDQGESSSDLTTTKRIRSELVRLSELSSEGKNVVIITRKGVVTLKGEVPNNKERDRILKISGRIAGARNIRNELTVTSTTK